MNVAIDRLRTLTNVLFDHLVKEHGSTVRLEHDYYWQVDAAGRHSMDSQPVAALIGQLSEDWQFLEGMIADGDHIVSYGLVWIASILRAIGESRMQ